MNCKPGDLAIVVKSTEGNDGKVLTCIKLHPAGSFNTNPRLGAMWEVDRNDINVKTKGGNIFQSNFFPDDRLRPLRDNPGQDETLNWAPVPKKEVA